MAGIGKLAKVLWKSISYLPKKAHALQKPFVAPAGGKLSIGKKLANAALKTTNVASCIGMFGATGLAGYELYKAYNSQTHSEEEEHLLKTSKYIDAAAGCAVGLLLGGPIGALALGAAAYFTPKDILLGKLTACKHGGKEITVNELRQQKATEVKQAAETEKPEQKEETPEVDEDKKAVEEFCKKLENLEVGQTLTVPEIKAESGALTMQAGDQKVELKPGDKITRTEEGFTITRADATENDKKEEVEEKQQQETQQEQVEEQGQVQQQEETEQEEHVQQQEEQQPETVQQTPPANNLFGGEINEITKKDVKIEKGDCLWNIAKRELQAVNQGKTITNAQILKQVKEFGRLNPNIKNLDLIYPEDNLKLTA